MSKSLTNEDANVNQAEIFRELMVAGFTTSLRSHTLPITIADRSLSGAVDSAKTVQTHENDKFRIEYTAAPIAEKNGTNHYFATKAANTVIEGIWRLIHLNQCSLSQIKQSFVIRFRKNDLRNALSDLGAEKGGTQLNKLLKILETATLNVTFKGDEHNKNTSIKMNGSYLQSSKVIESDDPAIDGLYEATLHPLLANDLYRGDFRDIALNFVSGNSELNEFYRSLLHLMRHEFTNADAKAEQFSFEVWLDELLWNSGKLEKLKQDSKRRTVSKICQLLVENKVITDSDKFSKSWKLNSKTGERDFLICIIPSIEWGKDQRRSNAQFKTVKTRIDALVSHSTLSLGP